MIDLIQHRAQTSRKMWTDTVRSRLEQVSDGPYIADLSESLSFCCQNYPFVSDKSLSLLMARALCTTGQFDAAQQVLKKDPAHRRHLDSWLSVVDRDRSFPELYPLFSSRLLRPLTLYSASDVPVWVLDLSRLTLSSADAHELILMQMLRKLTEATVPVWRHSAGEGYLGVKGLSRLSLLFSQSKVPGLLMEHICGVMDRCASLEGWSQSPSVLQIDL
jgi:hypothetical protein